MLHRDIAGRLSFSTGQELDSLLSSLPNAAMLSNGSSHDMGHREWQDDPAVLSKEDGSEQPVH